MQTHKQARLTHAPWPRQRELEQATKGQFALNAQAVQQIVHAFLANVETTHTLRREHPEMRMKYPWRTKAFYPVKWPAQAVHKERGRVVLPMGRGRPSLVLPLDLPEQSGACTLVWNRGFELHVCIEVPQAQEVPGTVQATVDLGEIHRRHHNGRMAQWEYGRDINYLTHKSKQARILSFTGCERGTSSRCPVCGHKHKPTGRTWACRICGGRFHRDLVGSVNMHPLAFGTHPKFPRSFTYLRPGPLRTRKRSSRAGTPQRCLSELAAQPHVADVVPLGTGRPADVA
jgi:putative transposase